MRAFLIVSLGLVLPLAACDGAKEGTTILINSTDSDGNVVAGVDGTTGKVSIDSPMFKGQFTLPKIKLDAKNFEMNGVHLYPGSTIGSMNVNAKPDQDDKDGGGTVRVQFDSPADPATVRDWFKDQLNSHGFNVTASGNGLTGTTDEKKPFKLDLAATSAGHSKGMIEIE
jgi:hypothetical protein